MAVVGVSVFMGQAVPAHDLRRTTGEQRPDDRVLVSIVVIHYLGQRTL
jgi:hypothetical protein